VGHIQELADRPKPLDSIFILSLAFAGHGCRFWERGQFYRGELRKISYLADTLKSLRHDSVHIFSRTSAEHGSGPWLEIIVGLGWAGPIADLLLCRRWSALLCGEWNGWCRSIWWLVNTNAFVSRCCSCSWAVSSRACDESRGDVSCGNQLPAIYSLRKNIYWPCDCCSSLCVIGGCWFTLLEATSTLVLFESGSIQS